jgi:hypothetical protein
MLSAKEVTVYGAITDTVLETGSGIDPVLKIGPAVGLPVAITAGCIEENPVDNYFAVTDIGGTFSVTINLPETCKYQSYYITVACTTAGKARLYRSYSPPKDSLFEKSNVTFVKQKQYVAKNFPDSSYVHQLGIYGPQQVKSGDTLEIVARTMAAVDNADTVPYPRCGSTVQITTSSGTVIQELPVTCNYPRFTYLSQKNSYFETPFAVVIPKNLQQSHPDFREDRTIKVRYTLGNGQQTEPYRFTVIDSDIKVVNLTNTQHGRTNKTINRFANMSIVADGVLLDIYRAGTYSLELFGADGRLIKGLVQNRHFEPGNHTLGISGSKASTMMIVRLTSADTKVSYQVKRLVCH